MPTYLISPKDIYSGIDDNGSPLVGGKLYTYIAGSATPAPTYTSASGVTENTNPIILDARGEARVWLSDDLVYKYILKDALDVTIRTTDNIQANSGDSGGDLSYVAHEDTLSIDMSGLGTAVSPLTASVLISSISANALGITTGGLYVSDLSEAVADKLDKVQAGAQSVVSEVTFDADIKVDGDITNSFDTSKISLLELSMILATSTGESITFGADTMLLDAGPSNVYLSSSGINFVGLNGSYQFTSVPDGTPSKYYAQDGSGNLVKSDISVGQGIVKGGSGEIKLGPHYLSMASSGVYSGGLLSVSGPVDANVNIGVTEGFVIDTSTFGIDSIVTNVVSVTSPIVFTPTNIATQNVTYVGLNPSGTQVEWNTLPTPEQRRDNIFLGVAIHSNRTTVEFVNNLQDVSSDITGQLHDLSRYLGYFNIEGNGVTANGANLNFNKALGTAFKTGVNFEVNPKDPDTNYLPAKVVSSFRYRTQTGGEGSAITVIDPTSYDVGGTITAIAGSNNQSTIQKIYIFPSNEIRIQYGQTLFSSFSDAISAVGKEPFVTESNIHENGLLLCSLVVKKGATDLSDTTDALFFQAGRFGETGSVGSTAVGTLQSGYDNSINPEILTNATLGALTLKNGQALDTDEVLEIANIAGTITASVDGNGDAIVNALEVVGAGTFGGDVTIAGKIDQSPGNTGANKIYRNSSQAALQVFNPNSVGDIQLWWGQSNTLKARIKNNGNFELVGQILQGNATDDGVTGIIGESLKIEGAGTFLDEITVSKVNDIARLNIIAPTGNVGSGASAGVNLSFGGTGLDWAILASNGGNNLRTYADGVNISTMDKNGNLFLNGYIKGGSYTTTEKNALTGLTGGEQLFDSTLAKLCFYNGSAWETITSV